MNQKGANDGIIGSRLFLREAIASASGVRSSHYFSLYRVVSVFSSPRKRQRHNTFSTTATILRSSRTTPSRTFFAVFNETSTMRTSSRIFHDKLISPSADYESQLRRSLVQIGLVVSYQYFHDGNKHNPWLDTRHMKVVKPLMSLPSSLTKRRTKYRRWRR